MPSAWINYLSNGRMHAFVSQAGGGYCWWKSPLLFRLTRYRMHHLPIDTPGFYVYVRDEDGSVWSPTARPCTLQPEKWSATHHPGNSVFSASRNGLEVSLRLFVAQQHDVLLWDLRIRNAGNRERKIDLFAYTELSQLYWLAEQLYGYYLKHQVKTWYDSKREALVYLYHHDGHPRLKDVPLVYFAATKAPKSFSGDRDAFMGPYRDERLPLGVERGVLANEELHAGEACAALHHPLTLRPGEETRLTYFLGVAPQALSDYATADAAMAATLVALRGEGAVDEEYRLLNQWWDEHLSAYDCQIPDQTAQRQISLWNPVNSVHTGRYSRAINIFAPGGRGIGFRDTCQDMLAIAYRKPRWATEIFHYLLTLQFQAGNTLHVAHPEETDPPDPKTHSDNHLWLPLLAHAIAAETGKLDFLDCIANFHDSGQASAWEHLLAAVRFTESHLGSHALPLTLHGDWNDIIGKFSRQGRGESVFAGQQYVYALHLLIALAKAKQDNKALEWLEDCRSRQEKALLACAWDGGWWRRGFDDDGHAVGSIDNPFGKLFLNPQSWAVLANVGTPQQLASGMQAVARQLDTGIGLKLLTPGFKTWPQVKEPFSGYGPGTGENGAIFCHANTWAVIAETLLGNGERAWKYFTQMIPHNVIEKVGLERYSSEPYAWVSNIVGPENPRFGWGNVSQVTGTAAWMDVAATSYLLGVRTQLDGLRVAPCVPPAWDRFSVQRRCRGTLVAINVQNPQHVQAGITRLVVDGRELPVEQTATIPYACLAGRQRVEVTAVMG